MAENNQIERFVQIVQNHLTIDKKCSDVILLRMLMFTQDVPMPISTAQGIVDKARANIKNNSNN